MMIDAHGNTIDLEAEFWCKTCDSFMDVRASDPDLVCDACDAVVATYRQREVIIRAALPAPAEEK